MSTQRPLQRPLAGLTSCIGLVALLSGTPALAETTIEGRINGLRCAEGGHVCPLENLDAHLSFELELVLQLSDGPYYFLSNVPRDTKVRHVRKQVRVIGTVIEPHRWISVDRLLVEDGDGYREVWSPQAQQQAFEDIYHRGWDATPPVSDPVSERR
ncbi:hypothetical protein CKO42_26545 [Lamprobacter modestohalophilus]|uniref:Uncharacterized protein n=1 Tax=Lamprobacter modestohalophilus TaxID=1064514 RepID=A0A9X0WE25_9GAMM|nr:hypothetical protein [Lamprobacter modestohalophilus]MBK1621865.1 hypothetical protein [Lamprobacter modestohalophilus]